MNSYPEDIESKLGFVEIRGLLKGFCQSNRGESLAEKCRPSSKFDMVNTWHDQTHEMLSLIKNHKNDVSFQFPDIDEYLVKVKVPGSFLDPADFHELKLGVQTLYSWSIFFRSHGNDYETLASLSESINIDKALVDAIDTTIDEKGEVRDNASPELLDIRTRMVKSERAVRSAIQKVLKKAKSDQLTDEDSSLTIRDGRLVIPLKSEHKKRIAGFIHDESATGQTVFIEPSEVLDLNNEVRELKYAERREIVKILIELSDRVREHRKELERGSDLMEKLDFIYAKTRLAEKLNGIIPTLRKRKQFSWINAYHPGLYLSHNESGKPIIPLTISLDSNRRILIISGPNAGGKSVALKTVGLIQYMLQSGLPVPLGEESECMIFDKLFLDIGDSQSIEDDLSTYSSHLTSMKHFLKNADKNSLFLIDEFGKGTEPQFGGAIAESVLEELNGRKSFGIITTHYQNLKNMSDAHGGIVNGAMKYDLDKLEPLFELEMGKPGSSFAFEIAGKIGLPKSIISSSKSKVGTSQVEYDQLLNRLEKEKSRYEKMKKGLERDREEIAKVKRDYEELREMVESERRQTLKEAKNEAKKIVEGANKDVERVIREIKESKASKEKTKVLREELARKRSNFSEDIKQKKKTAFKEGDSIKMEGQDTVGVVQKIKGKQVEVAFGGLKTIVSADKIEKVGGTNVQTKHQRKVAGLGIDLSGKMASFNHELDIRGVRAEEALGKVESFIDEALLLGIDEIRVLHGKGHGVLREIVRSYTKDHPSIDDVSDEHADRGGAGISIIRLK